MSVVSYLDCGCAILSDGGREWCPTCSAKIEGSYKEPQPLDDKELEAELAQAFAGHGTVVADHRRLAKIALALLPSIEETKKEEMERIVRKIIDYTNEFCSPSERKLIRYLVDTILKDK